MNMHKKRLFKILLVDDDEDDFILTRDILASGPDKDSYELSWCNNYTEAINAMLKSRYDIYLVDYRLGKYSGLDLLNEAVKSNCSEPIIILTGKGGSEIDEEALALGAADYLTKDELSSEILLRTIRYATRHHHALYQLKNSENKFRILFERSKDPIMITDSEGIIYEANEAAIKFMDSTHEELIRKNAADFYRSASNRDLFKAAMDQYGSVKDMELEIISAAGKTKYCSISSFLQISQHGHNELYYSILHDITYRKMQERKAALAEKPDAISRLAQIMATEIYNPLSNINFATEELRNSTDNQEGNALLEIIRKNCERINEITSSMIAEARAAGDI